MGVAVVLSTDLFSMRKPDMVSRRWRNSQSVVLYSCKAVQNFFNNTYMSIILSFIWSRTTGILKGQEGYLIRIARDRKLVMKIGDMVVAIGGIYKEEFEEVQDLVNSSYQAMDNG